MDDCADLELSLQRYDATHYTIDLRFHHPESDVDIRLSQSQSQPLVAFDIDQLRSLELDPIAYGEQLSQSLFGNPDLQTAFLQAETSAQSLDVSLRIRLFISPSAPELHSLRWETLRHPQSKDMLLTSEHILFSRYLSSGDWRPVRLRPKRELHAVLVVANPSNIGDYAPGGAALAAVPVEEELASAEESLCDSVTLTPLASDGKANLNTIFATLRNGCDILYLVAHGAILRGEPYIWLETEDGEADVVAGRDFVTRIRELEHRPRLIVLASCQSAATGESGSSTNTLSALGPLLSEAGVPAVLAMQGNITMETVSEFMPTFFEELQHDGQIDRAMAVARGIVRDRPDWWIPILFMRLKSGRIWYIPGFGEEGKDFEKWPALIRNIERGNCTPILGRSLAEGIFGPLEEVAHTWAETYRFPMAPHQRKDLAHVAQYLSVSQDFQFPRDELMDYLRENLLNRHGDKVPEDKQDADLSDLLRVVWKQASENNVSDPYKVLAEQSFSIYITANFSNTLADALTAAGKEPQVEICRWNSYLDSIPSVYDDDPEYRPSVERPLVYHLFGTFDEPDSLVLTEDDYFDYLLGVATNNDLIPIPVRAALADTGLLFLGFELHDWSFRILYRSLMNQEGRGRRKRYAHVAAQITPEEDQLLDPSGARHYLETYFQDSSIDIFWGSINDFIQAFLEQKTQIESDPRAARRGGASRERRRR